MKTVKSLLLGTAAGFVAFTGAQAADLPLAEPVEYVKVCDTYGKGYFYIPGTDTCLKLGGYVRFDQRIDFGDDSDDEDDFAGNDFNDGYSSRARASLRFDARTETEWGTLRSYVEVHSEAGFRGDSDTYLENGFIQFAGITAGRTSSFYDFVVTETYADFFSDQQVNTFAYTASFGSGFAATIGIEDRVQDRDATFVGTTSDLPNFIAALRVDQAWGSAQLSAAIQDNEGDENPFVLDLTDPLDEFIVSGDGNDIGFAIQAGLQVNLPSLGDGSYVWLQGTYSEGAVSYGFLGNGIQTGAFAGITDFDADGDNNELWAIGGGFNFAVTETVAFSASAAYIEYTADSQWFGGADFGSDDREIVQVAGRVVWTPVDNLHIGLEAQYTTVDFSSDIAGDDDADDLRLQSRIQRSW